MGERGSDDSLMGDPPSPLTLVPWREGVK